AIAASVRRIARVTDDLLKSASTVCACSRKRYLAFSRGCRQKFRLGRDSRRESEDLDCAEGAVKRLIVRGGLVFALAVGSVHAQVPAARTSRAVPTPAQVIGFAPDVRAGNLRSRFDAIILADQEAESIVNGHA